MTVIIRCKQPEAPRVARRIDQALMGALVLVLAWSLANGMWLRQIGNDNKYLAGVITPAPFIQKLNIRDLGSALFSSINPFDRPETIEVPSIPLQRCKRLSEGELNSILGRVTERYGVSGHLLRTVIEIESNNYPCAISPRGAMGLMQLMPSTARTLGLRQPFHPRGNVEAGARYLAALLDRYDRNVTLAVAAYNAGPGAVDRYKGVPPHTETQRYVKEVARRMGNGKFAAEEMVASPE